VRHGILAAFQAADQFVDFLLGGLFGHTLPF
jgi:hypothetical protein